MPGLGLCQWPGWLLKNDAQHRSVEQISPDKDMNFRGIPLFSGTSFTPWDQLSNRVNRIQLGSLGFPSAEPVLSLSKG